MAEQVLELPSFPYRFDLLLEIQRRNAFPARMIVTGDRLWTFIDGQLLCLRQVRDVIVMTVPGHQRGDCSQLSQRARHILGLDRDPSEFYAAARQDARLWRQIEPMIGLPLFCTETVFEALITLIIEQHITWKNALRAQQTLLRMLDTGVKIDGRTIHDFPKPRQLAALEARQLQPLKITNGRVKLMLGIARAGERDLERLREVDPSEAYNRLIAIKGIGHWTAANGLGRAFGKFPYIIHNDVALQAAVNHYFYQTDEPKSARQVLETLGKYGKFAGLLGHFILLRWVLDRYPVAS